MRKRTTPDLDKLLNDVGPTGVVQVIVELQPAKPDQVPGLSRMDQINHAKKIMSVDFDGVKQNIQQLGGEVLGYAWLNQTILASVPAGQVSKLASLDKVNLVDLPHTIRLESV